VVVVVVGIVVFVKRALLIGVHVPYAQRNRNMNDAAHLPNISKRRFVFCLNGFAHVAEVVFIVGSVVFVIRVSDFGPDQPPRVCRLAVLTCGIWICSKKPKSLSRNCAVVKASLHHFEQVALRSLLCSLFDL